MKNRYIILFSALAASTLLTNCSNSDKTNPYEQTIINENKIVIEGSSTVYPILKIASEIFEQEYKSKNIYITTNVSGTTKGFEKLFTGQADIIGASRKISESELLESKKDNFEFIELHICFDGIVVAVNKNNTWIDGISVSELSKIWHPSAQDNLITWNQVNPKWPKSPLNLYGPGWQSGTYDYFTETIVGKSRSSRKDFKTSEDDNYLVYKVSTDTFALGFFGYHYYIKNKNVLKALKIDNEKGDGLIEPRASSIHSGTYAPLSRPLYLYISKESLERENVKDFVNYLRKNIRSIINNSEYIPIDYKEPITLK